MNNNFSDEKKHQSLLKNYNQGVQSKEKDYSSQNHTQNISEMINSVTSPSANIAETENEQEVPPFKPMIIKSNSQAIGGGFESKTTTKKSPSQDKMNALKEAINTVNI